MADRNETLERSFRKEEQTMIFRRVTGWPSWGGGWNPFGEIDRIRQEMGRLQDAFARGLIGERLAGVFPLMNVRGDSGVGVGESCA